MINVDGWHFSKTPDGTVYCLDLEPGVYQDSIPAETWDLARKLLSEEKVRSFEEMTRFEALCKLPGAWKDVIDAHIPKLRSPLDYVRYTAGLLFGLPIFALGMYANFYHAPYDEEEEL